MELSKEEDQVTHNELDPQHTGAPSEILADDPLGRAFAIDTEELPASYYRSVYFIGSIFAIGLSLAAGVAGFSLVAPILGYVNDDIGPSTYIVWVALTYTLTGSVGLLVVGRLTDIFGRRWFFIIGSALALLGSIVCAVAPNVPALIAGMTLIGLASAAQLSYCFAVGELVPMKHRFLANGVCFLFNIPLNGFGPVISYRFAFSAVGWRGIFYLMIGVNVLCTLSFYLFYHPPTFEMKHRKGEKMRYIKEFDYLGTMLCTLGLLLFLMGISWGGSVYPWKSAHVIATIVVGFVCLVCFFLYETYGNLKEPLLPMHLFANPGWSVSIFLWGIGASVYYAFAIVWPQMVNTLYANGDVNWAGWAACAVGAGITLGEIIGSGAGHLPFSTKYQIIFVFFSGSACLAAMASCTQDTTARAIALITVGSTLIGYNEILNSTAATIQLTDQREIGTATGVGGSIRNFISTICATIYTVVLSNRLAKTIPASVIPAVTKAGLPSSSVASLLAAFASGSSKALDEVKGLTPEIQSIGLHAYKFGSAEAYKTVFLTTIAFSGVGVILTFFTPNINSKMTSEVTITLHSKSNEGVVGAADTFGGKEV